MKKLKLSGYIFLISFLLLMCASKIIKGYGISTDFVWATGTEIRLKAEIPSQYLNDETYLLTVTITLLKLNDEAVDIHDIAVEYKIAGYTSGTINLETLTSIGDPQTGFTYFTYLTSWGINYLQLKLTCRENIYLAPDPELYTDWENFLLIKPEEETSSIGTNTQQDTNPNTVFSVERYWWVFVVIGGIILIAVTASVTLIIMKRRNF
ncbi:MAG: hypothetical protein ACTSSG_10570 [Candidatus Heimdallarchaeaceae archaeon]